MSIYERTEPAICSVACTTFHAWALRTLRAEGRQTREQF